MMSLATIKAMSAEVAQEAADEGRKPMAIWPEDLEPPFNCPNIGSLDVSAEFEEITNLFCDSSGMGAEDEPALSPGQLVASVKALCEEHKPDTLYWAITEAGQFQVYISVYKERG